MTSRRRDAAQHPRPGEPAQQHDDGPHPDDGGQPRRTDPPEGRTDRRKVVGGDEPDAQPQPNQGADERQPTQQPAQETPRSRLFGG
ncbi:hypothetical protein M2440_002540 [Methylorubrum extorquens]|nr:hypothetical protein [Methylorubrum extorquens]